MNKTQVAIETDRPPVGTLPRFNDGMPSFIRLDKIAYGDNFDTGGAGAVITASILDTTMTVTAVSAGQLAPGQTIAGDNVTTTSISSQLTSTEPGGLFGGRGTYQVTLSQTALSGTVNSYRTIGGRAPETRATSIVWSSTTAGTSKTSLDTRAGYAQVGDATKEAYSDLTTALTDVQVMMVFENVSGPSSDPNAIVAIMARHAASGRILAGVNMLTGQTFIARYTSFAGTTGALAGAMEPSNGDIIPTGPGMKHSMRLTLVGEHGTLYVDNALRTEITLSTSLATQNRHGIFLRNTDAKIYSFLAGPL